MLTSNYFKYKGELAVSIAGKAPQDYIGREYKKLAPTYDIYSQYKNTGDYQRYTKRFFEEVLSKLNPQEVYEELGEDAVLLCYEFPGNFCHRRLVAKWFKDELGIIVKELLPSTMLECSSIGDKRFSAFYAKVNFMGKCESIEKLYQEAKRFNGSSYSMEIAKGRIPTSFVVGDEEFEIVHLSDYYKYLWLLYFQQHEYYLDYINQFDIFTDKFKGNSINCQADVIYELRYKGPLLFSDEIRPFIRKMEKLK